MAWSRCVAVRSPISGLLRQQVRPVIATESETVHVEDRSADGAQILSRDLYPVAAALIAERQHTLRRRLRVDKVGIGTVVDYPEIAVAAPLRLDAPAPKTEAIAGVTGMVRPVAAPSPVAQSRVPGVRMDPM